MKLRPCAVLGIVCLLLSSAAAEPGWKVGLAQIKITPKEPVFLVGYAGRNKPFTRVESDLWAKALVLEDAAGHRGMIITSDLIGFPAAIAEPICQRIISKCGVERGDILINSSHTHSGPLLFVDASSRETLGEAQAQRTLAYSAWLSDQVVEVASRAAEKLTPATLALGSGVINFAMNRREFAPRGVILGVNARGLVDRSVPVLRIDGADGQMRAVLFGAAVHGTTLTQDDYELCGDYASFAQEYIQAHHPGVQAMFMLGCAGDANPYPRGKLEYARRHGETLGEEVERVLGTKLQPVKGPLTTAFATADLPLQAAPSREELERWSKEKGYRSFVGKNLLALLDAGKSPPTTYRAPLAVWQFGHDLTLVGLPGEVVIDYLPLIERSIGPRQLWLAAYCNDVFGYLPSAKVLAEGGYETRGLYSGGVGLFAPEAEGVVVATVRRLAETAGREIPPRVSAAKH